MAKRKQQPTLVPPTAEAAHPPLDYAALLAAVGRAHQTAQRHAVQAINVALTLRNWLIGDYIAAPRSKRWTDRLLRGAACAARQHWCVRGSFP